MNKPTYLRRLKLNELSLVDTPANPHATVSIFKRGAELHSPTPKVDPEQVGAAVRKAFYGVAGLDERPGAQSFTQLLQERQEDERRSEAAEALWPCFWAIQDSIRSIVADATLSEQDRFEMLRQSVQGFYDAVIDKVPDIEEELSKALSSDPALAGFFDAGDAAGDHPVSKGENPMSDTEKQVAELQTQVADLTKQLAEASKRADEAEAKIAKAKAANDEVIKVGNTEIRKSVVGDQVFATIKSQQDEIAKQAESAEIAKKTEQVEKDYPNLPGDKTEKAKALMAVGKIDKAAAQTVEAMLVAGNKAIGEAMNVIGKEGEGASAAGGESVTKAETKLSAKANEIMKRDSVPFAVAYNKALQESPELYDEYLAEKQAA